MCPGTGSSISTDRQPRSASSPIGADGTFKITNTGAPGSTQPQAGTVHIVADIIGYYQ